MNLVLRNGTAPFVPRARLIKLLGGELIRDEVMAVAELVKNAHDADARRVTLSFRGAAGDDGEIVIEDDGRGMGLDVLLQNWMQPAGSSKASKDRHYTPAGRRVLGEKGVGRFAVDRLGRHAELVSRAADSDSEVVAVFDWDEFDDESRLLSDISVRWREQKAQILDRPGTRIRITGLRARWKERMFRRLCMRLQRLLSPTAGDLGFEINVESDEFPDYHGPLRVSFLDRAAYRVRAEFDGDATIFCQVGDGPQVAHSWVGPGDLECGPARVTIHCFDLETEALAKVGPPQEVRAWLREWSGISVYRNGFRVLPYGEPDDDWLRLDHRRVNNPMVRLSNNQVCGYVEIGRDANPELRDQTNRGGLLQNRAYEDLRRLVLFVLQIVEAERQAIRNPPLREEESPALPDERTGTDAVVAELKEASRQVRGGFGGILERLEQSLARERSAREQELAGYVELAAMGQGAKFASHALLPRLRKLRSVIRSLERGSAAQTMTGPLYMAEGALEELMELADLIGDVAPNRRASRRTIDVVAELRTFDTAVAHLLDSYGVSLKIAADKDAVIRTEMLPAAFHQVLHILMWNSLDALAKRDLKEVSIRARRRGDSAAEILFQDTGCGVPARNVGRLFDPGFTTKPNGGGMGLAIARRLLADAGGTIEYRPSSRTTRWTTFEISLSLKRSRATMD